MCITPDLDTQPPIKTLRSIEGKVSYDTSNSNVEAASIEENKIVHLISRVGPSSETVRGSHAPSREQDCGSMEIPLPYYKWTRPSPWSNSAGKRAFDCGCVLLTLPFWIPILFVVALAVRLTSRGPILFLQQRVGRYGRKFTILKFRTMVHAKKSAHHPITTAGNQPFTSIGSFLRRWKLDELPQVLNVLLGQMSLVGPRPKLPEHTVADLPCRPGVTGAATFAFAQEEAELASLPQGQLEKIYHMLVLPAKHNLDVEYMAKATFSSDLKLIFNSVVRRWDCSFLSRFADPANVRMQSAGASAGVSKAPRNRNSESAGRNVTTHISVEESASG